jgi:hypothetical protein
MHTVNLAALPTARITLLILIQSVSGETQMTSATNLFLWRMSVRLGSSVAVAGDAAKSFFSSFLAALDLDSAVFTLDTLGHMEIVPRAQGHAQLTISATVKLTISKHMSLCSCYLSRGNR